MSLATWMVNL